MACKAGSDFMVPKKQVVTVLDPGRCTPRMDMHMWLGKRTGT
jgi:hypothetical protein